MGLDVCRARCVLACSLGGGVRAHLCVRSPACRTGPAEGMGRTVAAHRDGRAHRCSGPLRRRARSVLAQSLQLDRSARGRADAERRTGRGLAWSGRENLRPVRPRWARDRLPPTRGAAGAAGGVLLGAAGALAWRARNRSGARPARGIDRTGRNLSGLSESLDAAIDEAQRLQATDPAAANSAWIEMS